MWRRTACIIALVATLASCRKSLGQLEDYPELLITHLDWVRFDVSMGRILAAGHRTKQNRQTAHRAHACGASETLAVTIDRGLISLQYALVHENWALRVKVVRRDHLEVEWASDKPDEVGQTITFTQPACGDIFLAVRSSDGSEQRVRSSSLWHLILVNPCTFEKHLLGVLGVLRPDWEISRETEEIRRALLESDATGHTTSQREIKLLVNQLADARFRIRQRADRELRARGRSAISFLEAVDPSQLDAEQRLRIQRIRASIKTNVVDSPSRVAAWLVNDTSVWLAMLSAPESQHREIARNQLARVSDRPIDFDPTASEAIRMTQVAALRSELLQR